MVQSSSQDSFGSTLNQSMGSLSNNVGQTDILRLNPGQEVSIRYKKRKWENVR